MAGKSSTAAEIALQRIEEKVTCAMCLEPYAQPKLLDCFHPFCEKCLQDLVGGGKQSLSCPQCRQSTALPSDGVAGLKPAFYIHDYFDIQDALKKVSSSDRLMCSKCKKCEAVRFCRTCEFVCQRCEEIHQEWDDYSTHEIIDLDTVTGDVTALVPPLKKTLFCTKHPKREADLYCDDCDELICRDCIVQVHRNHQYDLIPESFAKHEREIITSAKPVEDQIAMLTRAVQSVDAECAAVEKQEKDAVNRVHNAFGQLQQALEAREAELVGQVQQIGQQKVKNLKAQRNELQQQIAKRESCQDLVEGGRRTKTHGEILKMKSCLVKQLNELTRSFKPGTLVLVEQADLKFVHSLHELMNECRQFGKVYCHPLHPEKSRVLDKSFKVGVRGQTSFLPVEALDSKGEPCIKPVGSFLCELVTSDGKCRVRGTVKRRDENRYDITYQPQHIGEHQLHILIEDIPIVSSPFTVTILPTLTAQPRVIGNLGRPRGIALMEGGEVVVAERSSYCVSMINAMGEKRSFGSFGSEDGQFDKPKGVAVDGTGNILVADLNNHRIQQFSSTGKHLTTVGVRGCGRLQFQSPRGIAVDPNTREVYVVDSDNHRIQVLNSDLTYCRSFGSKGSTSGEFNGPYAIAVDGAGSVYVADLYNHRVQVFTVDGKYLRGFGKKGNGAGELDQPISIAVAHDCVYVGEYWNSRISIFSTDGQFIKSFGSGGSAPGQFNSPYGITLDKNGTVYVSDTANNRIQIFF